MRQYLMEIIPAAALAIDSERRNKPTNHPYARNLNGISCQSVANVKIEPVETA